MRLQDSVSLAGVLLLTAILLGIVSVALGSPGSVPQMAGVAGAGFLAGLCFALISTSAATVAALTGYGLAVVLTAALGCALTPAIGLLHTLLVVIFGAASLSSLYLAFVRIWNEGEPIRLEGDWGGLGHGFGGWQLSIPAAMLLSSLLFGSIAAGVVAMQVQPSNEPGRPPEAGTSSGKPGPVKAATGNGD